MDLNKYLNNVAPSEPQYSKEEYAAMKKTEREAVWVQVDARMGEVLADAPALQEFLNFMSQSRNSLPNQLLLSGQNADITDARTFQQWKDAGRHIRTGEEGYTAIVGQVYENNGRKASGYNIGKVFDITQTRGRPVPPPAEYQVDELIAASIESSPVPIQISDTLPDGIQAQYVPKNRTIYVRNGMDAGTTLCAIVRECAQADFHKDYTYNRQAYAAPSYCAAYMVAHRYGLDTTAFNFDRVVVPQSGNRTAAGFSVGCKHRWWWAAAQSESHAGCTDPRTTRRRIRCCRAACKEAFPPAGTRLIVFRLFSNDG